MADVPTTKMSSKGQVVIPDAIRKRLGLEPGDEFVVVAGQGAIILTAIEPTSMKQFEELMAEARRQARRVGLKRSDIAAAVTEARKGQ